MAPRTLRVLGVPPARLLGAGAGRVAGTQHMAPLRSAYPSPHSSQSRRPVCEAASTRSALPPRSLHTAAGPFRRSAPCWAPAPARLSDAKYHELANDYLERLLERLEALQDEREDVDVEFSAGVLTLALTDPGSRGGARTYVVNKQPPNKQIWLSSPISGPKRYDWVVADGADAGAGDWIYLKDGSSLNSVFRDEIGLDMSADD